MTTRESFFLGDMPGNRLGGFLFHIQNSEGQPHG
jgi:hypothetical protein